MKRILFSLMTLVAVLSIAGIGSLAHLADTGTSTGNIFVAAEWGVIGVEIDIKPGSYPNSINLESNDVIPVAILTTAYFDAATVDGDTVCFGPNEAWADEDWALEDVDNDGDMDVLFFFKTQKLNLSEDSTEATLTGETDGQPIQGTDKVNIVPKKGK